MWNETQSPASDLNGSFYYKWYLCFLKWKFFHVLSHFITDIFISTFCSQNLSSLLGKQLHYIFRPREGSSVTYKRCLPLLSEQMARLLDFIGCIFPLLKHRGISHLQVERGKIVKILYRIFIFVYADKCSKGSWFILLFAVLSDCCANKLGWVLITTVTLAEDVLLILHLIGNVTKIIHKPILPPNPQYP